MPHNIPRVKVTEFIRASRDYVQDNVSRANVDGNPYLTKTEAKRLPRDLKDNFEHHRVGGQANARVAVRKLETNFVKYVAANARKADLNGDGWLTAAESKKLPKDLRDNFWNYYRKTRPE